MSCRLAITALLLSATGALAADPPLPEAAAEMHEGVASCATSVCHGKVSPDPASTVWLNEYRVWLREDYHSRAYRTLQNAQSQAIAKKLDLPSAVGAKICLDCHADNVPAEKRGQRFQVSDGVGCEACHGGGGRWLESHAEQGTSHADNLAQGMYPTEDPQARARLCLSCHLGTKDKFATHTIMGAGHPRLAFELETFTVNQPRHYEVDADYRERKPATDSVTMWLTGLGVSALQTLELLQGPLYTQGGTFPELSFYQCHACHHPMNDLRWQPEGQDPLPPGAVRLNDASLAVLIRVLETLEAGNGAELQQRLDALHLASASSRDAVVQEAGGLHAWLAPVVQGLAAGNYDNAAMKRLRSGLVTAASAGDFRHFTAAEQVFLAVETLSIAIADADRHQRQLDAWFETVQDENRFVPKQFAVVAGKLREAL